MHSRPSINNLLFSYVGIGHEFNSLVLAMLHGGGGADLKLDASLINFVSKIGNPIHFETFVSLSCENCPDVVQMLNKFAVMNENISAEMIDGGLFPEDLSTIFPWASFYGSTMVSYLAKEEYVAGSYGINVPPF